MTCLFAGIRALGSITLGSFGAITQVVFLSISIASLSSLGDLSPVELLCN
jgi:hypothetical protein